MGYAKIAGDNIVLLDKFEDGAQEYHLSPPAYDEDVQWLVGPLYSVANGAVKVEYKVVDKTESELADHLDRVKQDKLAEIAEARYEAEIAGVEKDGSLIRTDRQTQAMISGAALKAIRDDTYVCRWKTANGFVTLGAEDIIAVADTIRDHVQSCFDREAVLADQVEAATTLEAVRAITWESSGE